VFGAERFASRLS